MAVTGSESRISKKSRHKKSPSGESINMHKKNKSGSGHEEQEESETDLDKPLFKLPRHSRAVSNTRTANGDISDSETDVDNPSKKTVTHKSVGEMQNAKRRNAESAVQGSDTNEDEDSDEQQSMSLLQMHTVNISSEKKSNQPNVNSPQKSDVNNLPASGALKSKVIRKPNVSEMSPSNSESDSEDEAKKLNNHHSRSQTQSKSESEEETDEDEPPPKTTEINRAIAEPQSESESEEEEDPEQQGQSEENSNEYQHQQVTVTALNSATRIKEEVHSNSESSFLEDDPPPLQELQNIPLLPPEKSETVDSQRKSTTQNPSDVVINTNCLSDIAAFERDHTRVSAPVIDIPQDSRIWVLQVPRSIKPVHLHGQYLPKKLKGGEVLNLPSGRWEILEQPHEASRSTLNCIISTGNFCYGMRWLQPRGFWFLKRLRTSLQMETADEPWNQEIMPLPIKELLKMKSNAAISKNQHLKPSKKRHRASDHALPNKRLKVVKPEDFGIIHQLFKERKKKVKLFNSTSSCVDIEPSVMELSSSKDESMHKKKKHHHIGLDAKEQPSMTGGEAEKGKKRKRSTEVNEETPKKKKINYAPVVDDQSHLEVAQPQSQGISVSDVIRSMYSTTTENISFRKKEKKKSKHKENSDDVVKRFSSPETVVKVKQENTADDSEWREHSCLRNLSGSSSDKKQKRHKKSHVERDIRSENLDMEQNESRETAKVEKKKKGKQRSDECVHGDTFQQYEKKKKKKAISSPSDCDAKGTEKPIKKEKKHSQQNDTSLEDTNTDVRKKKKRTHQYNKVEDEVSANKIEEDIPVKKKKKHKHNESEIPKVKQEDFWERETSPDFLNRLYLTQATPEDE